MVAAAVRYHAYGNLFHCFHCTRLEACILPCEVAHYTDDAHIFIYGYNAIFLKFVCNLFKAIGVVDVHIISIDVR